ncbi:unnamed protein product [Polarella glacialis]|uniref:Uncharacterized protein n=1 Tax=Polarella glacialis TaxID=89957 RepID=A0A813DD01_POLGL|nr:unnamed protein product [Polarella glacialis]
MYREAGRTSATPVDRPNTLFNDVHSVLHNVTQDLAQFRILAQENDEARRAEIDALRKKMENERLEHSEQLNKFRYEFEDFVHGEVGETCEQIELLSKIELKEKVDKRDQVEELKDVLRTLKENCRHVSSEWTQMETRIRHERPSCAEEVAKFDVDRIRAVNREESSRRSDA